VHPPAHTPSHTSCVRFDSAGLAPGRYGASVPLEVNAGPHRAGGKSTDSKVPLHGAFSISRDDSRVWYSLPVPIPLDCPGSLLPVRHLQARDGVVCDFCRRKVYLTLPPPEGFRDPWRGSTMARVTPHWSNPMKGSKSGN